MQRGNEEWSCNLLDISLKGMLVEPPDNLDIDTAKPCALALFLGEDAAIHARVKIANIMDNGHWGLQWLHIDQSTSISETNASMKGLCFGFIGLGRTHEYFLAL